jgi:squalene synthase HpnC
VVIDSWPDRIAYAHCLQLARGHYENFPVASWLLPAYMRPHVAAIYAFARRADDFADQPGLADDQRLEFLAAWHACLLSSAGAAMTQPCDPSSADALVFRALQSTVRACRLPLQLLEDLLSAFRQDVTTKRYRSWSDVLDYCRRSANPVGRLVLRIAGVDDPSLDRQSDAVCTALQLTNFWQDLEVDWKNGRLYVPLDDCRRAGALERDLDSGQLTPAWRNVLAAMVRRTRDLFAAGRPLCDAVPGRLKWELRATWLGGSRILDELERRHFDVFTCRPRLNLKDAAIIAVRTLAWRT